MIGSVTVIDKEGTERKVNLWRDAVETHYSVFEVGAVFEITNGEVVPSNKDNPSSGDFTLEITPFSTVRQVVDDGSIKPKTEKYTRISSLEASSVIGTSVNVAGVVLEVGESQEIIGYSGRPTTTKRTVLIGDQSRCSVSVDIYGDFGFDLPKSKGQILVANSMRVSQSGYAQRTLRTEWDSAICLGMNLWVGKELSDWFYKKEKGRVGFYNISKSALPKTIKAIHEDLQGRYYASGYYEVRATTMLFRLERGMYRACERCNSKVVQNAEGGRSRWGTWEAGYSCAKCDYSWNNQQSRHGMRYCMPVLLSDNTSSLWGTMFGEIGEAVMNYPASSLALLEERGNREKLDEVLQDGLLRTWKFRIRARTTTYMKTPTDLVQRIQFLILEAKPIDFIEETSHIINDILRYDH